MSRTGFDGRITTTTPGLDVKSSPFTSLSSTTSSRSLFLSNLKSPGRMFGTGMDVFGLINNRYDSVDDYIQAGNSGVKTAQKVAGNSVKGLGQAGTALTGVAGGITAGLSIKALVDMFRKGEFTGSVGGNALKVGGIAAASLGAVWGISTAATSAATLMAGSAAVTAGTATGAAGFLGSVGSAMALSSWGGPIAIGVGLAVAGTMAYKMWRQNQENKVNGSIIAEIVGGGIEGLGHDKFKDKDQYKDTFKITEAFKTALSSYKDASGKPFTLESFKNAPVEKRVQIRAEIASKLLKQIQSGGFDDPKASDKDKANAKMTMETVARALSSSNRDKSDYYDKVLADPSYQKLTASKKQDIFNQFAAMTIAASEPFLGNPTEKGADGKFNIGAMKKEGASKSQWDWMMVGLAEKALKAGVSFTPQWGDAVVDQKKYNELKAKSNKKGFDKLEGIEKLEIVKYELMEKLKNQPKTPTTQPKNNPFSFS